MLRFCSVSQAGHGRAHRRHRQKHDHELLLAEHRMANQGVGKACQTPSPFLHKRSVGRQVIAIDGHSLGRQQRQLAERISLVQAVEQPHKVAVPAHHLAAAARASDLVVAVLKQKHALFFGDESHRDDVLAAAAAAAAWGLAPSASAEQAAERRAARPTLCSSAARRAEAVAAQPGVREAAGSPARVARHGGLLAGRVRRRIRRRRPRRRGENARGAHGSRAGSVVRSVGLRREVAVLRVTVPTMQCRAAPRIRFVGKRLVALRAWLARRARRGRLPSVWSGRLRRRVPVFAGS